MRLLLLAFAALLVLSGCASDNKGEITIQAPSGKTVEVVCTATTPFCDEVLRFARYDRAIPMLRMICPSDRAYSFRGFVIIDGKKKNVAYRWDCNTMVQFKELRLATEQEAKSALGSETGKSDYS